MARFIGARQAQLSAQTLRSPILHQPPEHDPSRLITGVEVGDGTATVVGTEVLTETGTVTATGGAVAVVTGTEVLTETGTVTAGQFFIAVVTGVEIETETGTVTADGGIPVKLILAQRRAMSWPPFLKGRRGWKGGNPGQKWL